MVRHDLYQLALRGRARSLAVVPAPDWAFEDVAFTPRAGIAYVQEQYVPAVAPQVTLGGGGELELTGIYVLQVFAPAGTGLSGTGKYAQGLLALFPPGFTVTASNGDVIRIRSNPVAPYREQVRNIEGGRSLVPVNIPFVVRTLNS